MQLPSAEKSSTRQLLGGISSKHVGIMLFLFLLALGIRLLFVNPDNENVKLFRDEQQYVQYAHNLTHHHTFSKEPSTSDPLPDSYRSPGYPLFIAVTMIVGGKSGFLSVLFYSQAVLSALMAPLTFLAGIVFLPIPAAVAAALLTALSPHLITTAPCVLSETLFAFLLLAAVCTYLYAHVGNNTWLLALSATLFGFAYLANEIALLVPFVFAGIYIVFHRFRLKTLAGNQSVRRIGLFLLVFAIFPAGWMLRNAVILPPDAERGSARAVTTMSHGAYPNFIYKDPYFQRFPYREDPDQPAFGSSFAAFVRILTDRARNEPGRYLAWYLIGKPYYFWRWSILQGVGDIYIFPLSGDLFSVSKSAGILKTSMQLLHPWLVILALLGIPLFILRHRNALDPTDHLLLPVHCFAICIYATGLYMVFAPWPRYSIPFRPELYLCAMWTVCDLVQRVTRLRHRRT